MFLCGSWEKPVAMRRGVWCGFADSVFKRVLVLNYFCLPTIFQKIIFLILLKSLFFPISNETFLCIFFWRNLPPEGKCREKSLKRSVENYFVMLIKKIMCSQNPLGLTYDSKFRSKKTVNDGFFSQNSESFKILFRRIYVLPLATKTY
jgi:hypothetical protein